MTHLETDTIFSSRDARMYEWRIIDQGTPLLYVPGAPQVQTTEEIHVRADTAGHACDYICRTRQIPRHYLSAELLDG